MQKLNLYGLQCECYKPNCKVCHYYTLDEIDELIKNVLNTISSNKDGYLVELIYDYKSCFSKDIDLIGNIYLDFLYYIKDSLVKGYKLDLDICYIQKGLETIKDYISTSVIDFANLYFKNIDGYNQWVLENPEYEGFTAWERALKQKLGIIKFEESFNTISCELIFDTIVETKDCKIIFNIISQIKDLTPILKYEDELNIKDNCIITTNDKLNIIQCNLQYKELLSQYNCNLKIEEYLKFLSCGISHEFIMNIYKCGLSLKDNIINQCPDIIINEHAYNVCELSFIEDSNTLIKNLKEITLYANN